MNKKLFYARILAYLSILFVWLSASVPLHAATAESILSFDSVLTVNTDNSVTVQETIVYDTGSLSRHGIYRDIYPYSSQRRRMSITDVSVTDEQGNAYQFDTMHSGNYFRIKIGDPDVTFSGEKTYVIRYRATRAVAHFSDTDEIYWNALGDAWEMPIDSATATVILPSGVQSTQSSCYFGTYGSTDRVSVEHTAQGYACGVSETIYAGEDLSIAVGFSAGIVQQYSPFEDFLSTYLPWIIAIAIPVVTGILCFWYWYKKGRDPKGRGVIVPQYDVPDNLTPFEVDGIVNQKVQQKNISAELVYLATRGFVRIEEIQGTGIFKKTDYKLVRVQTQVAPEQIHEQRLLAELFGSNSEVVLSTLKNHFYKKLRSIVDDVLNGLLSKGYYKNLGAMSRKAASVPFVLIILTWVFSSVFSGGGLGVVFTAGDWAIIFCGLFIAVIMVVICLKLSPAKTEKGVETREYLLGLKEYMQIAEKDRMEFHNAPEKKPEVFEQLLPFAMVMGVTKIWAKEFADIYTTPPSWYVGTPGSTFNAIIFSNSLTSFSSFAGSSMSSAPGSSGGGFAGGGGGGGGGGGW